MRSPGALLDQESPEVVSVVGLVGDQVGGWWNGGQERSSTADVGGLSRCQEDGGDAALLVRDCVDLGRPSTARPADRLVLLPPFTPAAERWARTEVLSTMAICGGSAQATRAAKISCQWPRWLQRLTD